jgi:hypothetical protein
MEGSMGGSWRGSGALSVTNNSFYRRAFLIQRFYRFTTDDDIAVSEAYWGGSRELTVFGIYMERYFSSIRIPESHE